MTGLSLSPQHRQSALSLAVELTCKCLPDMLLGSYVHSALLTISMSYAIIRTGGKQFRVEPGMTLRIPSLVGEAGASVEFNDVLLGSDGNSVRTGVPTLSGAKVTGEIVKHGRGEKIVVFKFKRRKNYARKQGHRQGFTEVRIKDITLG
jgi:large subunit ribosomal protein L21